MELHAKKWKAGLNNNGRVFITPKGCHSQSFTVSKMFEQY